MGPGRRRTYVESKNFPSRTRVRTFHSHNERLSCAEMSVLDRPTISDPRFEPSELFRGSRRINTVVALAAQYFAEAMLWLAKGFASA